jgi:hypothetical protein
MKALRVMFYMTAFAVGMGVVVMWVLVPVLLIEMYPRLHRVHDKHAMPVLLLAVVSSVASTCFIVGIYHGVSRGDWALCILGAGVTWLANIFFEDQWDYHCMMSKPCSS